MSRVFVGNLDPRVSERELEDEFRTYGAIRSVWVARKPPGYAFIEFEDRRDAQDAIRDLDGKNGWRVELSHNSRGSGGGRGGGSGRGGRDRGGGGSDLKCYECGEPGHFARECRMRIGSGGLGGGRRRSRTPPRYRRSPSYGRRSLSPRDRSPRRRSISPPRGRSHSKGRSLSPRDRSPRRRSISPPQGRSHSKGRSLSPRDRSPRRRSISPPRGRSHSKSPPYKRGRDESPPYKHGRAESPAYANGNSAAKDMQRSRS